MCHIDKLSGDMIYIVFLMEDIKILYASSSLSYG